MKVTKRLIAFFMAAMMIFSVLPVMNVSAKTSGKLTYEVANGEVAITGCDKSASGKLTIPSKIDGYPVTSIKNWAFYMRTNLKSITIPDSVTSIGEYAFDGCSSLKSLTIPDSVTSIGGSAFYETGYYNNSSNWKNGVLYIGNHLIKAKDSIEGSYKIKSGTKCIANQAFSDCADLTSVTISDSVTSIGGDAFSYCSRLTSITIPDSVTVIKSDAFQDCEKLSKITMSDNIKNIGQNTFSGTAYFNNTSNWKNGVLYIGKALIKANADKLSGTYTVKDGTKCIADYAFSGVHYLESIKFPDSVTHIGSGAFSDCGNLKSITLPRKLESIGFSAFYFCSFENLTVPGTVKTISEQAFLMCKIENLTIGNGVKKIGSSAFDWSNLKSVKIPDSVTSIENKAFSNCGLESVFIPKSVKSIGAMAFGYKTGWAGDNVKIEGFKIEGIKGSAAETYAKENGFKFVTHKHSYTSKVTTKATTSKNGKITYTCDCGYSYSKSISKIKSVTLSNDTFTYNGKVKQPTVTVKDSKGNTLKKGTDYTVKYSSGRKNVGKYTVTVTFKGKYSGTKKLTFKIKPRSTSISKLTAGKKQFTATWTKQTTQVSGYQLQYSTSSKMTNAKSKTLSGTSKNSLTVSNLKSAKKYYVRIRTYKNVKIDGKTYKYYSAWSSVKSVKTK